MSEEQPWGEEKRNLIPPLVEKTFNPAYDMKEMFAFIDSKKHKWELSGFNGRYLVFVDWTTAEQLYAMPRTFVEAVIEELIGDIKRLSVLKLLDAAQESKDYLSLLPEGRMPSTNTPTKLAALEKSNATEMVMKVEALPRLEADISGSADIFMQESSEGRYIERKAVLKILKANSEKEQRAA